MQSVREVTYPDAEKLEVPDLATGNADLVIPMIPEAFTSQLVGTELELTLSLSQATHRQPPSAAATSDRIRLVRSRRVRGAPSSDRRRRTARPQLRSGGRECRCSGPDAVACNADAPGRNHPQVPEPPRAGVPHDARSPAARSLTPMPGASALLRGDLDAGRTLW